MENFIGPAVGPAVCVVRKNVNFSRDGKTKVARLLGRGPGHVVCEGGGRVQPPQHHPGHHQVRVFGCPPSGERCSEGQGRGLLKVFTLTRAQRAQRLLSFPQTVDERPSVVLDKMLALLPSDVDSTSPGFLFE